ncbi:MAG: hypothetical protein PVI00_08735 [Desulfobacterales bacterium]|jgi:hypothetical protein
MTCFHIVFWHDLAAFTASRGLIGLLIALAGAYLASIGNIVSSRNTKKGIPVTQANAFGMSYGGMLTLLIHFAMGGSLTMDWTVGYLRLQNIEGLPKHYTVKMTMGCFVG